MTQNKNAITQQKHHHIAKTSSHSKNKNAGLVGPAASLLLICGERLVYVSGPRGSLNCLGPHRYGPRFTRDY